MISASVVLYNTKEEELQTILTCLKDSGISKIVVIDNSPANRLEQIVKSYEGVEYIFGHGNIGYGAAHNIAIRSIRAEEFKYHIILNTDIIFDKDAIEGLKAYMDSNRNVGWVMPKIVYPDGTLQYLCKLLPTPLHLLLRRFIPGQALQTRINSKFELRQSRYNSILEVPFLSGCFVFARTTSLQEIKGFSDKYWMYCEDLDMCRRMGMHGYKTMFNPHYTIIHAHRKESYANKKMLIAHIKSAITYFNTWGWFFDAYRRRKNDECLSQINKKIN